MLSSLSSWSRHSATVSFSFALKAFLSCLTIFNRITSISFFSDSCFSQSSPLWRKPNFTDFSLRVRISSNFFWAFLIAWLILMSFNFNVFIFSQNCLLFFLFFFIAKKTYIHILTKNKKNSIIFEDKFTFKSIRFLWDIFEQT